MQVNYWNKVPLIVALTVTLIISRAFAAQPRLEPEATSIGVTTELEAALLADDWARVAQLSEGVKVDTPSAVLRLIKGHASLALNRSNESLALFASAIADAQRVEWQSWSEKFSARHKDSATAWYFHGDALARRRDWDGATKAFDHALLLQPQHFLSLNARGVIAHAVGNTLEARTYFVKSGQANPSFAEAFASRGTLNVYLNSVGAEKDYRSAMQLSADKNPVVSLVGLGCAEYGKGDFDKALGHFAVVPVTSSLHLLAQSNSIAVELARLARSVTEARAVGTTLQKMEITGTDGTRRVDVSAREGGILLAWNDWEIWVNLGIVGGKITGTGKGKSGGAGSAEPGPKGPKDPEDPKDPDDPEDPLQGGGTASLAHDFFPQILINIPADPDSFITLISEMRYLSQNVTEQRMAHSQALVQREVGGADSDTTRVRSDRGKWQVANVFGLLYPAVIQ